jgi:hypothetical protein
MRISPLVESIKSHSCFYDLCLGSPTDCVNFYGGTRLEFQPIQFDTPRGIGINVEKYGILDPEQSGFRPGRDLQNQDIVDEVPV